MGQGIRIRAEVHLVLDRLSARPPIQDPIQGHARASRGRGGSEGLDRHVEEPDLAQAGLLGPAGPVAVDGQLDVLGLHTAEVHGGVVDVVRLTGRLGELRDTRQGRPGGPVRGGLDRHVLGPKADGGLNRLIGVPHPHLVQLVDPVELVLDPDRGTVLLAEPHL